MCLHPWRSCSHLLLSTSGSTESNGAEVSPGMLRQSKVIRKDFLSSSFFNFSWFLIISLLFFLHLNYSATPRKSLRTEEGAPGADMRSKSSERLPLRFKESELWVERRENQPTGCVWWSSWHEVLAFMFIFGCIFLSPLMQISGLGSNPTVQVPKLPKVSRSFWLGRIQAPCLQGSEVPQTQCESRSDKR